MKFTSHRFRYILNILNVIIFDQFIAKKKKKTAPIDIILRAVTLKNSVTFDRDQRIFREYAGIVKIILNLRDCQLLFSVLFECALCECVKFAHNLY